MRGKNRIGYGLGALGIALTAWLGILALPNLQVEGWWLVPVTVAVVGIGLILWGVVVLGIDARRAKLAKIQKVEIRRAEVDAERQQIEAEIAKHDYWRMVADNYGDGLRLQQINATLAELRAKLKKLLVD